MFSDKLDEFFDRLAVARLPKDAEERDVFYHRTALKRAREILRSDADSSTREIFETRIRLALHLSPSTAIAYNSADPRPRWKLIRSYLVETFGRDASETEALARDVQLVLDNWDNERASVTDHLNYLLKRDGPSCQSCKVSFHGTPLTLQHEDEYKPYHSAPDELLRPEVDHVEAISALGTNELSNLQILCRLCNSGKGRGLGLAVEDEVRFAGSAISNVPVHYRGQLLYYVIQRDKNRCARCASPHDELTVRPSTIAGGYIRSNLHTVCVNCLFCGE